MDLNSSMEAYMYSTCFHTFTLALKIKEQDSLFLLHNKNNNLCSRSKYMLVLVLQFTISQHGWKVLGPQSYEIMGRFNIYSEHYSDYTVHPQHESTVTFKLGRYHDAKVLNPMQYIQYKVKLYCMMAMQCHLAER